MSNQEQSRSIFRTEAVERHIASREKSIWPRFIRPRVFFFLWILLGLLLLGGVLTWWAEVPVYASGTAVVTEVSESAQASEDQDQDQDQVAVLAFLPPETLAELEAGQAMFLIVGQDRLPLSISEVEPEVLSPALAREQFGLTDGIALVIEVPSAVIQAPLPLAELDGLPVSSHLGSVYDVEVEVGSRRVVSLIPYVGQFF